MACKRERSRPRTRATVILAAGCLLAVAAWARPPGADKPLLTPQATLTGARTSIQPNPVPVAPRAAPLPYALHWLSPTAVTARNGFLYVADSGRRHIFRYDTLRQVMTPFAEHPAGTVLGMAAAPDLTLYVADANGRQIRHYGADGRLLRTFTNAVDLGRPVAVLLDETSGHVLAADSLYNHVLVFNSLGQVVTALKSMETHGLDGMATGPDGLYLLDRRGRQVAVVGRDGQDAYTIGAGQLVDPNAIAVDRHNRAFVSDLFDNSIKVFARGELIATIGGTEGAAALFNRVAGLWLEHELLYVADDLNGRVHVFRVAPPGVKGRANE